MDVADYTWTALVNMDGCENLKFLHLESEEIMFQEFHSLLSKLPLLEELYVSDCKRLDPIKISNPLIKTLVVGREDSNPFQIDITAPSLQNFFFIDFRDQKKLPTVIKVANCCRGLETLILSSIEMSDREFCKLISEFPLLENLWINGCQELRILTIRSHLLKTLHIARYPELRGVKVYSPNLLDMYCMAPEGLKILVTGGYDTHARGRLRYKCEADRSSQFWSSSWEEMLKRLVKDEALVKRITRFLITSRVHILPKLKTL